MQMEARRPRRVTPEISTRLDRDDSDQDAKDRFSELTTIPLRGELQAFSTRQSTGTRRFSTVNEHTVMNNESEKNESRTESVATSPIKRSWHSPEIEEVDFAETQNGAIATSDGVQSGHS